MSSNATRLVNVSVDVEEDISLYLRDGRMGLVEGLPRLLDLFRSQGLHADLFVQGDRIDLIEDLLREATTRGHRVGLHGARHRRAWTKPEVEEAGLRRAAAALTRVTGQSPGTHRAPNFRLMERHLPLLERLRLLTDSSILPNLRYTRFRGRILRKSYEGAPRRPYHPSRQDVARPGDSRLVEVPVTENPLFPGAPLGLGYLHTFGLSSLREAASMVHEPYLTFLIHTWEAVDLGTAHPGLPSYVKRECGSDLEPLAEFLGGLAEDGRVALLEEIAVQVAPEEPRG